MNTLVTFHGNEDRFFTITTPRGVLCNLSAPVICLDGDMVACGLAGIVATASRVMANGVLETVWRGTVAARPDLSMQVTMRHRPKSPFFRYCFMLEGKGFLEKPEGRDRFQYLSVSVPGDATFREVRISTFEEAMCHSYHLDERVLDPRMFAAEGSAFGPILCWQHRGSSTLFAYEHGSMVPNRFVQFAFRAPGSVVIEAVRGNYLSRHDLAQSAYESIWLQGGGLDGDLDMLAAEYRDFILRDQCACPASRTPYIYYNTWNFQERNKWWHGKPYLADMTQERMLAEIEVAHRMGIDMFVMDTGWYGKPGDWAVNTDRFDGHLRSVREALEQRGMKLGLWFSPKEAALTSRPFQEYGDCIRTWDGVPPDPFVVWETEKSTELCLVSRYWEELADRLIRLHREVGVTYFKLDGFNMYGCNDSGHEHGGESHTPRERADVCFFNQVRYLSRVIERLADECPEAIADFDVTESGRAVGLAFLAVGKFFLMNNGPYYNWTLDDPEPSPNGGIRSNVLVFPGAARARNCRSTLDLDRWVPSVLFLTHYLPDAPAASQEINIASLILGHNGIWGDLVALDNESIERFGRWISIYKQVRDDMTAASPVRDGAIGSTPEIHEKINPVNGRGAVALFTPFGGSFDYITKHAVDRNWIGMKGVTVELLPDGCAHLRYETRGAGAAAVFFGAT